MEEEAKFDISTESYKGVRDFYPEDLFIQNYIFDIWRKTALKFGYVEYGASILEDAALYKAKSGEEIVNEQTYTFTDRGDREVTLRPEMTPTVARMVAKKEKELTFPVRWFSIPNLFRYEKPQRGRLREHWQLNVDIFGVDSIFADSEIINISYEIMRGFGAKDSDFKIKINDRRFIKSLFKKFELDDDKSLKLSKILDKKDKISEDVFMKALEEVLGEKASEFASLLTRNDKLLEFVGEENSKYITDLTQKLLDIGIQNVEFDPTLMRGFDYYTGIVFEVFDTHPENNRSVFGGGRYDELMDIFGSNKIPSVGFGAGDVTARDFLEKHDLLPKYSNTTKLYICTVGEEFKNEAIALGNKLREKGVNTGVDLSSKKLGDQIKYADKYNIPYVLCLGENEVKSNSYTIKKLESGEEKTGGIDEIVSILK